MPPCSSETGANCQARKRLPEGFFSALARLLGRNLDTRVDRRWLWKGRRVCLFDGSTVSMPDTPANRRECPLAYNQVPGTSFAPARIGAIISLSCGAILDLGICRYARKGQGEVSLLRRLWEVVRPGDVLLGDRPMSGWVGMHLLKERGVDTISRLSAHRRADIRKWARLGKDDHLVVWHKPTSIRSVDRKAYDELPGSITIREARFRVVQPGFRTRSVVVVTTLLDPAQASREELAELYRARWNNEVCQADYVSSDTLYRCPEPSHSGRLGVIGAGPMGKGLRPAAPADKRTLIRRATFDLIGLPPTPEEVEAFLADGSEEAFARVVERLLASPRYGERWGRHWLDVVRYADARDLIQLPPESDFREAWRYRDWVVSAFNRDLPYPEFLRHQVAGDLLPPTSPGGINADGLVATGMLAIADFVPGDVDKDQMIADYVSDQVDVIGRAVLGLSLACARCHDHKFDPFSTEDYYALAGIFFSTRLVPGPVPGNTPLVRAPLLPQAEIARFQAEDAADARRSAELERMIPDAADREYLGFLNGTLLKQTADYLVAACEVRGHSPAPAVAKAELARARGLDEKILGRWVDYLGRVESQPLVPRHPALRDAASGRLIGPALDRSAEELHAAITDRAGRAEAPGSAASPSLAQSSVIHLRADDPHLVTDADGRVTLWPSHSGLPADARAIGKDDGPTRGEVVIEGHDRPVLRFDGQSQMEVPRRASPAGSLFVVFRASELGNSGQRLLGWEDSDVGQHGLGLMVAPAGPLRAILRDNGRSGDLIDPRRAEGFEVAWVTWGAGGTALHRNWATVAGKGIEAISSDAGIAALRVGGPGSGSSPRFRGDIAEIRVYDRQLDESERRRIEGELREAWFKPADPTGAGRDLLVDLFEELVSSQGPFWLPAEQRLATLPESTRARLAALNRELDELKTKAPREIPRAVVVRDWGPPGTRHEGFKDAAVFVRGNPKKLGKTVPRGFPRILTGEHREPITEGSGRRQLADWLGRPDHPLTARVMVNRIWPHHFGDGLVRTPDDFGKNGERPTHPGLLDHLASRFVDSGWSIKSMHRLIMLTSAYQQGGRAADGLTLIDPENRLLGRMDRRRLDAEAIRDSLLAVAGRLDLAQGGQAFLDLGVPRSLSEHCFRFMTFE